MTEPDIPGTGPDKPEEVDPAPPPDTEAATVLTPAEIEAANFENLVGWETRRERARRMSRRAVDAEEVAEDSSVVPGRALFSELAALDPPENLWLVDKLIPEDGRVTWAAYRKAGKTVAMLNLCKSLAGAGPFLDVFGCAVPGECERVAWLNLELSEAMAHRWVHRLVVDGGLPEWVSGRIVALSARGAVAQLAPTRPDGAARLVDMLAWGCARQWIIDPVGPLMAACGLKIGDDMDVGVFMSAVDRIAERAGVREVVYVHHIAKNSEEDFETAKGATRWEDAVDSIVVMGRHRKPSEARWIRAEGRDVELPESDLTFDPVTLHLSARTGLGISRREIEEIALVAQIVEIVRKRPGLGKSELRGVPALKARGTHIDAAIGRAISEGKVFVEVKGGKHQHFAAT